MSEVYIYALIDPTTKEIRYIGKTIKPEARLSAHMAAKDANRHKCNWIKKLKRNGKKPVMEIIEVTSDDKWKQRETYWIHKCIDDGCRLTNLVDGGNGFTSGYIPTSANIDDTMRIYLSDEIYKRYVTLPFSKRERLLNDVGIYSLERASKNTFSEIIRGTASAKVIENAVSMTSKYANKRVMEDF